MNIAYIIKDITISKAVIVIIAVGFLVYGNTIINQMFWDDYDGIVNNQYIRSWDYFPKYFSESLVAGSNSVNNYWRPLVLFSFSVDYKIGGLEPAVYHLQNIFWHILASILIVILARKLSLSIFTGLLAALFFLVHPLQTEAVTYISGRADPMHLAFMLAGLIYFIKAVEDKFSKKYYFSAIVFFVLALLTRERSIIFILLISLYLVTLWNKSRNKSIFNLWRKKIMYIMPFVGVGIVYVVLRMTLLHFEDNFDEMGTNNINSLNWYGSILIFFKAWAVYAGLIIWPADLHMTRLINAPSTIFNPYVISGIILMGGILVRSIRLFKKEKFFIFGIGWLCIGLIPTLYTSRMQGLLAEHWLYPVLPAVFLLGAFYIERLIYELRNKYTLYSVLIATIGILVALSVGTIIRNNDWQNPIRFYEKNISVGGTSAIVYTNLGMAYAEAEKYNKAMDMYELAISQNNNMFQPWYNKGNIYRKQGKYEQALISYQEALIRNENFLPIYKNSAIIYIKQEKYNEAIIIMNKSIDKFPYNVDVLYV